MLVNKGRIREKVPSCRKKDFTIDEINYYTLILSKKIFNEYMHVHVFKCIYVNYCLCMYLYIFNLHVSVCVCVTKYVNV